MARRAKARLRFRASIDGGTWKLNMESRPEVLDPKELRLNEVLGAYLEAEDAGWAPERDDWLVRYPDLADDLRVYFAAAARVNALAYPPPVTSGGSSNGAGRSSPRTASVRSNANVADLSPVGVYEVHELIKEGGMGSVFKAWQKGAERWVALKRIKTGRLATHADVRRFRDEAEAAAHLDHPNIVPIYEVGERDGEPYFSMKYFEYGSLQQHLPRFQKDHRAAARLVSQVARAVHYAHQHGILHRDLKPANILLDAQEQPYVADFGLAKRFAPKNGRAHRHRADSVVEAPTQGSTPRTVADPKTALDSAESSEDDVSYLAPEQAGLTGEPRPPAHSKAGTLTVEAPSPGLTREGTILGTHGFMPPEHAGVSREGTSTSADVYSLGAILYKILTGKTLFEGAPAGDAIRQLRECAPARPRIVDSKIDARLEAVCLKCLEKEPKNRYPSAEALADDLDRWLKGEPPLAWPMPWRMRAWRAVRRHLLLGSAAMLFGAAAATVFFVYYYFDPERVPLALEEKARNGRVVLIGEAGPPTWSHWNVGEDGAVATSALDQPFSFTIQELGRIELLRKVGVPRYRFSAQVKHDIAFGSSFVGIYLGHHRIQSDEGLKRYWFDVVFADNGPQAVSMGGTKERLAKKAKYGKVFATLSRHGLPRGKSHRPTEALQYFESAEGGLKRPEWRRVAVEVTPEKIQVFWEGQALKELDRGELRKLAQPMMLGNEIITPEFIFDSEGALGLYVDAGKASFRQVVFEPLP